MPSITETVRSVVPESTGKKDVRAEKASPVNPRVRQAKARRPKRNQALKYNSVILS